MQITVQRFMSADYASAGSNHLGAASVTIHNCRLAGLAGAVVLLAVGYGCSQGRSTNPTSDPAVDGLAATWILIQQADSSIVVRPDGSETISLPAADWRWSPDGTTLLGDVGGQIVEADTRTGDLRVVGVATDQICCLSPQGDRVLLVDLTIIDIKTGARSTISGQGTAAGWSPDGTKIAIRKPATIHDDSLFVVDIESERRQLVSTGSFAARPFSADGQRLLFARGGDGSGIPTVYDLAAKTTESGESTSFFTQSLQWAADNLILWDSSGSSVHLWNLETSQVTVLGSGIFPVPSPHGDWAVFRGSEGILPLVSVAAVDGGTVFEIGKGVGYAWSPDGTWVAVEQPPWIYLRSVPDAEHELQLIRGRSPRWSPVE